MSQPAGRVMAIDFGLARIGVAVSDPLRLTARGIETVKWNGKDWTWALDRIEKLAREHEISDLVMGLPRRTDGQKGHMEETAREFGTLLEERLGIRPVYRDERYTSVLASRLLNEVDYRKNKRNVIDQVAAEIILQDYLESQRKANNL